MTLTLKWWRAYLNRFEERELLEQLEEDDERIESLKFSDNTLPKYKTPHEEPLLRELLTRWLEVEVEDARKPINDVEELQLLSPAHPA